MSHEPDWCPTMEPTRQDFQRPFTEYVAEVFAKNPGLPMFKVAPPAGWRARRTKFPDLKEVKINTPIRQHVFGTRGAYRCIFVEQKELSADEFKRMADIESKNTPAMQRKVQGDNDAVMERSFWGSMTLTPPLYGADTPVSFFDPRLPYGWNLRDLGDLLKTKEVPHIPGVTTPMTYFGMWRSFFGWHKEDADLLSINYLHWGAPKMWYCVSPKNQAKFERMAQGIFPQLHQACHAFIRHKDIMLSPSLLRTHGIPFMQAKQEEGQFIVLNSSAYHSGFNMGFNCAEAINFATPAWIDIGKAAEPCRCHSDTVHISMKLFDPEWTGSDTEVESEEEDGEEGSEKEEEAAAETPAKKPAARKRPSAAAAKRAAPATLKPAAVKERQAPAPRRRPSAAAAATAAPEKKRRRADRPAPAATPALVPAAAAVVPAAVAGSPAPRSSSRRRQRPSRRVDGPAVEPLATAVPSPALARPSPRGSRWRVGRGRLVADDSPLLAGEADQRAIERDEVVGQPLAIVGEDERGTKFFCLVQRVKRTASNKNMVVLRWLREGPDGLYRPFPTYWEERQDALIGVRTKYLSGGYRKRTPRGDEAVAPGDAVATAAAAAAVVAPGAASLIAAAHGAPVAATVGVTSQVAGWSLLTLKARILETELLD